MAGGRALYDPIMMDLIRLYGQIATLRRGPQDVPGTQSVLVLTIAGYFAINVLVSLMLPPIAGPWLLHLGLDVVFTLAWYAVLLRLLNRPERFVQTASAVFGYQAVLSPLWVATGWLIRRFQDDATWLFPVTLLGLVLVVWMISANAQILKAAIEWSTGACVGLVILQIIVGQALIIGLVPVPEAAS